MKSRRFLSAQCNPICAAQEAKLCGLK